VRLTGSAWLAGAPAVRSDTCVGSYMLCLAACWRDRWQICPAGTFGSTTGQNNSNCTAQCPLGSYSASGATSCTTCMDYYGQPALYSDDIGSSQCQLCPAGRFGSGSYQTYSTSACGGPCSAVPGRYCSAGTWIASGALCPAGRFSSASGLVLECSPCPAGRYGDGSLSVSALCTGACVAVAGKFCGEGAVSPTPVQCPAGKYSLDSAAVCRSGPCGGRDVCAA
jgi:hypothetical protein